MYLTKILLDQARDEYVQGSTLQDDQQRDNKIEQCHSRVARWYHLLIQSYVNAKIEI